MDPGTLLLAEFDRLTGRPVDPPVGVYLGCDHGMDLLYAGLPVGAPAHPGAPPTAVWDAWPMERFDTVATADVADCVRIQGRPGYVLPTSWRGLTLAERVVLWEPGWGSYANIDTAKLARVDALNPDAPVVVLRGAHRWEPTPDRAEEGAEWCPRCFATRNKGRPNGRSRRAR